MRTCSESIAQLAAALAKAQMELVNPIKSLTGVIDRWGTGNEGQTYRYAPLRPGSTSCAKRCASMSLRSSRRRTSIRKPGW
jgi:hypothetical protein